MLKKNLWGDVILLKNWRKTVLIGFGLILMLATVLSGCGSGGGGQGQPSGNVGDAQGAKPTITFGVTPWTSTVPPTQVAKAVLEEMGYTVKLQDADAGVVFAGLSKGDIDVFMDAWLPDMHKNYMEKYKASIEDVAVSYPDGELGWVIPSYVNGIESVEDLKGKEDLFDKKVYGIEEGAGMTMTSREMIKGYGLDMEYQASSEPGMLTQAKREIDAKKPILFLGWRPHSMFVKWDLKVLKDPKQYFKTSEVHVLVHKGLDQKAPEAYAFLKNWSIPVGDVEKMILQIEEGTKPDQVAKEWIAANQEKVNQMMGK